MMTIGSCFAMERVTLRRLSAQDWTTWAAVRDLCCRTGDDGAPIAPERWALFARIWIEPYQKLLPDWSYVAETPKGLAGYLTGCPDSRKFSHAKRWRATLPLLVAILVGRYRHTPGTKEFVNQALGLRRSVEDRFNGLVRESIERSYPAHLHINVDADYRRAGVGRRLIETYLSDLRSIGVRGIHLFCGAGPVEFYLRLGFKVLDRVEAGKTSVFALGIDC
jgi:GNAT superfamily N-acetyltransferase